MRAHVERARMLIQRERYELAEKEARLALVDAPEDSFALAMLSLALLGQEKKVEAERTAREAVSAEPDSDFALSVLAAVLNENKRHDEALQAIDQAIEIDPHDADHWGRRARILIAKKKWDDALMAADNGLGEDPQHVHCKNLRSLCLQELRRFKEAAATAREALREDPDNAFAHATSGWACLRASDYRQAETHFREALRQEPDMEWARQGVLTSLKARSVLYRSMLRYFFWMSQLPPAAQWGVIIGFVVGRRFLQRISDDLPPVLRFVALTIAVLLALFLLLTWVADPLSNLVLMLHPFGRLALTRGERRVALGLGGLVVAALGALIGLATTGEIGWGLVAAGFAAFMIPLSATASAEGSARTKLVVLTVGLGAAGLGSFVAFLGGHELAGPLGFVYVLGVVAFTWIANIVASRES